MNRRDLAAMAEKEQAKQEQFRCRILCCASTPCLSSGGSAVQDKLNHLNQRTRTCPPNWRYQAPVAWGLVVGARWSRCKSQGDEDVVYENVTPEMAEQIVEKHAVKR